jgi:hypothetical protein
MDLEEIRRREQYPAKKERYIQDREADLQQSAHACIKREQEVAAKLQTIGAGEQNL